ncbi:MAG: hypothetical protein HOV81_33085 [Kofleriaceae bacterium]|nr:hypothetical protein [Kofleriaceae bacterium]
MIPSSTPSSEAAPASSDTAAGATDVPATTSPSSGSKRTGMDVVKPAKKPGQVEPPPTKDFASEQGQAQEKRMNRAFEAARCRAPGMAQRYAALDAEGKKKLREQCAAVGVTLAE